MSTRTFFNYFASKEAAVVDAPPDTWQRLEAALSARPATETPLDSLHAAASTTIAAMAPGLQELAELVHANPTLGDRHIASFAVFRNVIIKWAAERTGLDPATSLYPELLATVAGAALQVAVERYGPGQERELTTLLDEVFDHFASGLAVPAAPEQ